jgi:hypothetical protein
MSIRNLSVHCRSGLLFTALAAAFFLAAPAGAALARGCGHGHGDPSPSSVGDPSPSTGPGNSCYAGNGLATCNWRSQ